MSRSALSVRVFGIYLLLLGPLLMVAPNVPLSLVHLPETREVWLRVAGVVVFNLAVFYLVAAELNHRALFKASIFTRFVVAGAFLVFVALKLAGPPLLLFGAVDALGATWTLMALLGDRWRGRVVTQI